MTDLSANAKRALLAKLLRERAERGLERGVSARQSPLMPRASDASRPLSFGQERMWFLDQLNPGSPVYNLVFRVELLGPLNVAALRRSVERILERHDALRTSFPSVDGRPSQYVASPAPLELPVVDLRSVAEGRRQAEARRVAVKVARQSFDLSRGPLLRTTLVRLANEEHVLVLIVHHIVADGWSLNLLFRELALNYAAAASGADAELPVLPVQYADFAAWHRQWMSGTVYEAQRDYWLSQLGGSLPMLELPTDRLPPPKRTFEGATLNLHIDADVALGLRELSRREGVTLFTSLLAAFKVLLLRYTGQEDMIVGTLVAGRVRPEVEHLIGFFVNTLALRTNLSGDPTFLQTLERTRKVIVGAHAHADLPFEKLIEELQPERDLSRSPLFQVIFNMLSFGFDAEVPAADLRMRPVPSLDVLTVTDGLTLYGFDTRDQLDLSFVYSPELFDADTIGRMAGHFHNLLRAIVADPGQRVSTLPLLTEAERDRLLVHWNATDRSFPTDRCYVEHVESHAAVTPNAVAVVDDGGQLTYGELNAWANGVARSLIAAGVGPNRPVAVYCERSRLLLVWVLAIFKAGGAYLPLDPRHPPGRVTEILGCSGPTAVLVADHLAARLAEALSALPGDERPAVLPERDHGIQDGDDSNPPSRATPENLAYIIFTSGSTGVPKGAMVPQRAMLNHFWSKIHGFGLTSADSVVQSAPQGFDISVWQLLAILLVGGRVRIASDSVTHEPERLFQLVLEEEPTLLEVVPSFLRAYLDSIGPEPGAGAFGRLRWLVLGGEALTPDLCRRWLTRWPGTPMVNGYGPSECADDAARYLIDTPPADDVSSVPIGRPIDNVHLYVLDRNLALVPQGVPGELCIGGKSVGLGYLNDPERTAAAFTDDPYGTTPGARLYRTGDRARIRSDGVIEFLGRVDHQVKIRGHRIELGEIEALLARHARVGQAIVSVWRTPTGDRLAAYIVADDPSSPPADDDLRDHLRRALPAYMVPDAFVLLERMPLNANGKVNRKALPSPTVKIADDFVPPLTSTEIAVARIWSEILDAKRVGVHDNFFELGGHSLLAARVAARMRRDLDVDLPVRALFEMQTVGELGAHLEALLEARASREELSL